MRIIYNYRSRKGGSDHRCGRTRSQRDERRRLLPNTENNRAQSRTCAITSTSTSAPPVHLTLVNTIWTRDIMHQAFLIARVRPHGAPHNDPGQRRCIAAFHHQWCYGIGSLPLLAMRCLVTLVSHPENAVVLRAELRSIDGQYGHGCAAPTVPDIPCPYAASLLGSAWTTDLDAGREIYISGWELKGSALLASMGCWDGDNNDGISVLDITDPEHPAYCFLQSKDVLDAYGYLTTYYPYRTKERDGGVIQDDSETESGKADQRPSSPNEDMELLLHRLRAIYGLESVPVITADILREAWPYVRFRDSIDSLATSMTTTEVVATDEPSVVPSLVDLTFGAAVKHSLESEDTSGLERFLWLPGKASEIKKILRDLIQFLHFGIRLLVRVLSELQEDARVDLSDFQRSGTQIVEVLSGRSKITFLNASFNSLLVADDVPKLLEVAPSLRRLVIIGCPSIVDAHILALVQREPSRFKSLEGLLRPAFLTVEKPKPYPTAFTLVSVGDSGLECASVPFFTPVQVVQALIDVLPWKDAKKNRDQKGTSTPMMGFSAFHSGTWAPDEKFGRRPVVSVPCQTSLLPRGQNEFWAFFVSRTSQFSFAKNQKNMWGFVHFTRCEGEPTDGSADPPAIKPAPARRKAQVPKPECAGQLYDLRGFLESMASEGRPMPSEAAVTELERILYKKHRKSGRFYCRFMREKDLEKIAQF
ncbi:hypothetical protein V8D89_013681 [Ganoderma adspersum]